MCTSRIHFDVIDYWYTATGLQPCKNKVIFRELIATSQTIVFAYRLTLQHLRSLFMQFVVLQYRYSIGYSLQITLNFDFATLNWPVEK